MQKIQQLNQQINALENFLDYHYRSNIQNDLFKEMWKRIQGMKIWTREIMTLTDLLHDETKTVKMGVSAHRSFVFWQPETTQTPVGLIEKPDTSLAIHVANKWLFYVHSRVQRKAIKATWKRKAARAQLYANMVECEKILLMISEELQDKKGI